MWSMSTRSAISAAGITRSFGSVPVLRGVDFSVDPGSVFALLGANGAGKTTLVRILATLLTPDSGTADVGGHDVRTAAAMVRECISLTGQFTAVDDTLTGHENLALVARLRHLPKPNGVADDMLERFALTEAGTRRAGTYSGGMRRKFDIAMSLVGNPPVVFLDEPTTGLDPQARLDVWSMIRDLAAGGATVLLTTQYLDEAEHLADRIAILHDGVIIENSTLAELRAKFPPVPSPTSSEVQTRSSQPS